MLDVSKKNWHKTGLTGKDNFVQNYYESGIKKVMSNHNPHLRAGEFFLYNSP